MNKNLDNDILKLLSIIANNNGISIRELNTITSIPMEVIKRNLEYVSFKSEFYFLDLQPEIDYQENDENYMDKSWTIGNFSEDIIILNLNRFEKYLFKNIINIKKYDEDNFLGIKTKSIYKISPYKYKLCQISLAIENRKILKVLYRTAKSVIKCFFIEPIAIVFYEFENIFYVLGQYNHNIVIYRLDRIEEITEKKEKFKLIEGIDVNQFLSNVWGMEQGQTVEVKVKFIKEANVEYNAKRDLNIRINKKITQFEGYFIYEDNIVGINSFKNWLRSFGSSAIILEPEWLRNEMIDSAMKALEYYSKLVT